MKSVCFFALILPWVLACTEQPKESAQFTATLAVDNRLSLNATNDPIQKAPPETGLLETGLMSDELSNAPAKNHINTQYETIAWTDLIPKEDLEALLNPPQYILQAQEGSVEDQISSGLKSTFASKTDDPYQRALVSKNVVAKYDGRAIKLAGFVVPLAFNDDHVITEFFLVPFFGACIHVPAPPPNQIIFVRHSTGFKLDELYNPIWVLGVLSASLIENDMATSAYTLDMASFEFYQDPN